MIVLPHILGQVADVISTDGFLQAPPVVWSVAAEEMNDGSLDYLEGRYHASTGNANASAAPKIQDTYISGTSGRTGRAFTLVSGTVTDGWRSRRYDAYGLQMYDARPGQSFEVVSAATTPNIEPALLVLRRGPVPHTVTPTSSNFYAYLHLAYNAGGGKADVRVPLVWGKPICAQVTTDGTNWNTAAIARELGTVDHLFHQNQDTLLLWVRPDFENNLLCLEINHGNFLVIGYPATGQADPTMNSYLPYPGNIRFLGMNGWATLEYYPLRHGSLTLTHKGRNLGYQHPGASRAFVSYNARTKTSSSQSTSFAINTDGQNVGFTLNASLPDSGDGLGSSDSPRLSDAVVVLPPSWSFSVGGFNPTIWDLRPIRVEEIEDWNDQARCFTAIGTCCLQNVDGYYDGAVGHQALNLMASIDGGATLYQRLRGISGTGEGVQYQRADPYRTLDLPFQDMGVKMQEAGGIEVDLDGWCLWSAVLLAATIGNIHPQYLRNIPYYCPPGAPPDAPYGPAGSDCPYFVLPRGSGLNAKLRVTPEMNGWNILQMLAQELGEPDPTSNRVIPYYFGFDPTAQFHFEPWNPFNKAPSVFFSDAPGTQIGMIQSFRLLSNVEQVRTAVTLEGLDAITNQLIYAHAEQPDIIKRLKGWRSDYIERNARWGTLDYLQRVGSNVLIQSSLPDTLYQFETTFIPWIHAGQTALLNESATIAGTVPVVINRIHSRYGHINPGGGQLECISTITCRALATYY